MWPLSVAAGSGTGRASSKRLRATGERASEAGDVCQARVAGQGPDRAPRRRKASRIGNPLLFNRGGGANDLGRRARLGAHAHGSIQAATRRQNPSPRSSRGVDNARAGRREQLVVSGLGGVETPVRWRHTVLPWQHAARCRAHGCSSLKMWVASVGRTRLWSFREHAIARLRRAT